MPAYALICQEEGWLVAACLRCCCSLTDAGSYRYECTHCGVSAYLPEAKWSSPGARVSLRIPVTAWALRGWVASWLDVPEEDVEVEFS